MAKNKPLTASEVLLKGWRTELMDEEDQFLFPNLLGKLDSIEHAFRHMLETIQKVRNDRDFHR